jgi:hypothetical protein
VSFNVKGLFFNLKSIEKESVMKQQEPYIEPLFSLGRIVATRGVIDLLEQQQRTALPSLIRHAQGDWGHLSEEDRHANEQALQSGARLFSVFFIQTQKIWIITEASPDKSQLAARPLTTLLLPEEY